jgi:phosphomannomutase
MSLKFSVSGLRGIVDKDLTSDIVFRYATTFGKYIKPGKVVIGRDTRRSGRLFREVVIKGLNSAGCSVVDLGIVPTPTVLFMVRKLKAHGGIAITASHNPVKWNALKFASSKGQFLGEKELRGFSRYLAKIEFLFEKSRRSRKVNIVSNGIKEHIDRIVTVLKPKARGFKIGVDAVNGAGSLALPMLLQKIGCKVYRLNCKFRPDFPRKPEPVPENIKGLCQLVRKNRLDIGLACDPDCDRLSLVDENGRAIGEENTLVLATDFILSKTKGNVVTNLSTTSLMDYITEKHKCKLYRTKVGEANVISKMKSVDAIIGGEGNGGIIYPKINLTRDALVGAAIIVRLLTECEKKLSEILASYPKYYMMKKKIRMGRVRFETKKEKIIKGFRGRVDYSDGVKIVARNYWLHVRPSQTEPVIRIIGESRNKALLERNFAKIKSLLM